MSWKPLQLSASAAAHLPPLLIANSFTAGAFSVHLTDLTHIWSESLSRNEIIKRSRKEATSIDPSDDDQFRIFLDKIQVGLAGGKNTTLSLTIGTGGEQPALILNVSVELPGGLAALEWPIQLSTASQGLLTSKLTIPLVRAQHKHMQEVTSLVNRLKEKDNVIQKLLDKLEGQGVDLGQVFPQAAGKAGRKGDRKKADERVKGLGAFDMDAWQNSLPNETAEDMAELLQEAFPRVGEEYIHSDDKILIPKEQETWWDNIQGITIGLDSGKISTSGMVKTNKAQLKSKPTVKDSSDVDSDFQVQATPPRLRNAANHVVPKAMADDSTDDDDDLDAPSQRSKIPDSFPVSPPHVAPPSKPKNIKTIGGKRATSKIDVAPVVEDESTADEDNLPPLRRKIRPPISTRVAASREESTEDEDLPPQMPTSRRKTNPKALVSLEKDDESTEDENHVPQKSAPRRKANRKALSPKEKENESTEDGASSSEASMLQKKPVLPVTNKSVVKPKKVSGKIGGKKSAPPPEPEHGSEPEPELVSPPRKAPLASETVKPKRGKFTIGGKKKPTEPIAAAEQAPVLSDTPPPTVTPEKRKIGHIGHERAPAAADKISEQAEDADQARGRVPIRQKEEKLEIRETSMERANRRRQELKRELEQKAQAPVKKKRRF